MYIWCYCDRNVECMIWYIIFIYGGDFVFIYLYLLFFGFLLLEKNKIYFIYVKIFFCKWVIFKDDRYVYFSF